MSTTKTTKKAKAKKTPRKKKRIKRGAFTLPKEQIKVENGTPPEKKKKSRHRLPFDKMDKVGSFFWFNHIKGNTGYVYATMYAKEQNNGWQFRWEQAKNPDTGVDGFRIWRVA